VHWTGIGTHCDSSFEFPRPDLKPKQVPTRADLQKFYAALDTTKGRALFLIYATSGFRENEIPSLCREDVDLEKRMIVPRKRNMRTSNRKRNQARQAIT